MKTYQRYTCWLIFFAIIFSSSCEEYLEKTPVADISEDDIFRTFDTYQGYVETMYDDIVGWVHLRAATAEFNWGDDVIPTRFTDFQRGDYFNVIRSRRSQFYNDRATRTNGVYHKDGGKIRDHAIWQNSWFGIRAANISLAHLDDLIEATDEQRRFLEGQAYFFRGYFHWELMKAWGKIPYVDKVLAPDDDLNIAPLNLHETAELIVSDLQKAADLLPLDWDLTETGQKTFGINRGRATKGMALSVMAECLLYNGSPLFNGVATGSYTYNTAYCERAADAAWQVIEIANQGIYKLEPWATYSSMFFGRNDAVPVSDEIIFRAQQRGHNRYTIQPFTFGHVGRGNWYTAPSQNYVELFEMANGLPIDDPASGFQEMDRWANRDPRFGYNILIDGERIIESLNDDRAFVEFFVGGRERTTSTSLTGYGQKKYWDTRLNKYDNTKGYRLILPKLRLAEIYLIYAEAANEAYGPSGKAPGAAITAVESVDIVRTRAGMPGVNAKFTANKEDFRARVWNERAVELAFEGKRWYDTRRWYVAHLPKYKELYGLEFDEAHTYYNRTLVREIPFAERHYWLPFPTAQVNLYSEWTQNPGW